MERPALTVQEVFLTKDEAARRSRLEQLAAAWLRTVAGQVRP